MGLFTLPERARLDARASWLLWTVIVIPVGVVILVARCVYVNVDLHMRPEKSACRQGDFMACVAVGEAYVERGNGKYKNDAVAEEYLDRACQLGWLPACDRLGWVYTHTDDDNFSVAKAAVAWDKACTAGFADACTQLGHLQSEQLANDSQAIQTFGKGCSLDAMESCFMQGALLINGDNVPRDPVRGHALAAKACAGGYQKACQ